MIGDLIARGERIWELALCKSDYGRDKCQEVQLIRVFGTHRFDGAGVAGVRIWSVDGRLEHLLQSNKDFPSLTLSQDGRTVAVGDGELLRVWDVKTGAELARRQGTFSFVFAGSDDQLFALFAKTGHGTDSLRRIPWRTEDLINDACRRLQRQLDEGEQKHFLHGTSQSAGCVFGPTPSGTLATQP
jgi:hypothetical protein